MKLHRFFLFLIALGMTAPALADQHEAMTADMADTWIVVVKDGHDDEFEKAFKAHLKYREQNGDPRDWKTYAPILGDDLNHYAVRHCCSTYAAMDDYAEWQQKNKTIDHWNDNVDQHVAEYRHYFAKIDLENNNWPEDDSAYQLFGVTSWENKSGRGGAISRSKKELSDAAKAGGWTRYWAWSNTIGGDGGLMLVTPYMNYADMQPPKGGFSAFLAKQVGEEKAVEMLSAFSDNFHGSSYTLYRKMDDMSMGD